MLSPLRLHIIWASRGASRAGTSLYCSVFEPVHTLPCRSESNSPWSLGGDASSGSADSPSASLDLLPSSSGSAPSEKESQMAELGPDSFSAKALRQPGALPGWLLC